MLKHSGRQQWLIFFLLLIPAALQFFPIFYLVCMSFKVGPEAAAYPPKILPQSLNFTNYGEALDMAPLTTFLINSVVVAAGITLCQILTAILAAFALARLEFKGKRVVLALIVATMMVPGEVTIIPNYFTLASLDWLNTYRGLILPFSASGFGIFLLYNFFRTIPKELEEAVVMDGGSRLRFLFQFVVPLSMPSIIGFGIYAFVSAWNQYLWPLVVTQSTKMQTAQIGIGMFRSLGESINWGIVMAATTMLIAPTVILFIATQRQFVKGITSAGLKG